MLQTYWSEIEWIADVVRERERLDDAQILVNECKSCAWVVNVNNGCGPVVAVVAKSTGSLLIVEFSCNNNNWNSKVFQWFFERTAFLKSTEKLKGRVKIYIQIRHELNNRESHESNELYNLLDRRVCLHISGWIICILEVLLLLIAAPKHQHYSQIMML